MIMKLNIDTIIDTPSLDRWWKKLNMMGKRVIEELATSEVTAFEIGQIEQGVLPTLYMLPDFDISNYDFYMEIDSDLLDKKINSDFPLSEIEEDGKVTTKTLRDYLFSDVIRIKDDKALVQLDYWDISPNYKQNENNLTFELLKCFIENYSNDSMSNIYTEAAVIDSKIEEFDGVTEL